MVSAAQDLVLVLLHDPFTYSVAFLHNIRQAASPVSARSSASSSVALSVSLATAMSPSPEPFTFPHRSTIFLPLTASPSALDFSPLQHTAGDVSGTVVGEDACETVTEG
jgi:hypothetical protein